MTLTPHDLLLATRYAGLDLDTDEARIAVRRARRRHHRNGNMLMGALFGITIATMLLWTQLPTI